MADGRIIFGAEWDVIIESHHLESKEMNLAEISENSDWEEVMKKYFVKSWNFQY